jgi:hypothetical protein
VGGRGFETFEFEVVPKGHILRDWSDLYSCILIDWICAKCDIFRDSIMSKMPLKDVLYLSNSI